MAPKRPSGAEQLKRLGKAEVSVTLDADQLAALDAACEIEGRTRPRFMVFYALAAARKIIENNSAKSIDTP